MLLLPLVAQATPDRARPGAAPCPFGRRLSEASFTDLATALARTFQAGRALAPLHTAFTPCLRAHDATTRDQDGREHQRPLHLWSPPLFARLPATLWARVCGMFFAR